MSDEATEKIGNVFLIILAILMMAMIITVLILVWKLILFGI